MMETTLSTQIYRPADRTPKAVLFVVHGMQEHQGRYAAFASYLNRHGYACITYDLPGHGKNTSTEDLGFFGSENGWNHLVNSAVEITMLAKHEFPGIPVIYFGHSMGTMIGRSFLQVHDGLIDAMILSGAPCYQSAAAAGKLIAAMIVKAKGKKGHSKVLDNLATGSFNKTIENPRTPVDWLSYNDENVDRYIADELCGFSFTNQGYLDLFKGMTDMSRPSLYRLANPDLPILLYAGEDDPCIGGKKGWNDTKRRLKDIGYRSVESRLYPHMRHETLQEADHEKVMQDIVDWCDHLSSQLPF